jgi:ABC-type Fe3+ transport system permease subunit
MNDTVSFLIKVSVLSAALSALIKYGGRWLPLQMPYTEQLNSLVMLIVMLPSLAIGLGLVSLLISPSKPSK